MSTNVKSILGNEGFAKFAAGAAGAIVTTTALKAVVRPMFIMADKKSDTETKKYTAAKELLYQALCLGIAFSFIPIFNRGGFNLAKKYLKNDELVNKIKNYKDFKEFKKDHKNKESLSPIAKEEFGKVNGGVELCGSFVGSILGLTVAVPIISGLILHPILKAIGMEKKEDSIGQPIESYLGEAKVPTEKADKINISA